MDTLPEETPNIEKSNKKAIVFSLLLLILLLFCLSVLFIRLNFGSCSVYSSSENKNYPCGLKYTSSNGYTKLYLGRINNFFIRNGKLYLTVGIGNTSAVFYLGDIGLDEIHVGDYKLGDFDKKDLSSKRNIILRDGSLTYLNNNFKKKIIQLLIYTPESASYSLEQININSEMIEQMKKDRAINYFENCMNNLSKVLSSIENKDNKNIFSQVLSSILGVNQNINECTPYVNSFDVFK
ncbi:MAG: hypothetical protein UT08_C0007G0032 [Candidatus Woesebacteria bacterium GW2011_GWB1_38_8]|uniref:Uncharacterized protein n=1 Tax=Candidatus Woesebacteria bacterium GW2011_GWB1_38_8 TaxID=1618570 RepID=A0A0G0NHI6_9BACT|nr:MAG: hypothetical protein UT08_C0007G0032 [Candidatus Woesebacteria bacterium GW2011_GWB1_38_8]